MKSTNSYAFGILGALVLGLAQAQEPAAAPAVKRIAVFDGVRQSVIVQPAASLNLKTLPGTHALRIGEWGVPGRTQTRIVSTPSRARQTWGEAAHYPTDGDVQALASADFNGDSFDDAAIATSAGVEIRLGRGDGTLGNASTVFPEAALALAPADFNGDGLPDLAVASNQTVALLYGDGHGAFPTRMDLPVSPIAALLVADLNHDSIPDLVLAPRDASQPIELLQGDGREFHVTRRLPGAGAVLSRLAAADFDLDGHVDIAAALAAEPRLLLFLHGDTQPRSVTLPARAEALGILDQGSQPHLTVRLAGRDGVFVMANDGRASFAEPIAAPGVYLDQPASVATDLNNDAAPDRLFASAAHTISAQPNQAGVTAITKTHTGTWSRGDFERMFTIQVTGSGTPTITDTPSAGLELFSMGGSGWECTLPNGTTGAITCFYVGPTVTNGPFPPLRAFVNVAANAPNVVTNTVTDGQGVTATDTVVLGAGPAAPDLTIAKSHTGDFTVGQTHTYTITVTNIGTAVTSGVVTMTEIPSTHFSIASLGGPGWTCSVPNLNCSRLDALAPGASYPPITVAVVVANTSPSLIQNDARVDGGGDANLNNNATFDITTVLKPDLSLSMNHTGNFRRGQVGAQFFVNLTNVGTASTVGTVTVTHTVPSSLTPTALSGTGWTCTLAPLQCSRANSLAPGASYPTITLTVDVSNSAPGTVIHQAEVSGGNDTNLNNNFGADLANVDRIDLTIAKTHTGNFLPGARATYTITVTNSGQLPTTGLVTVTDTPPAALSNFAISGTGWTCQTSPTVSCTRSDALAPGASYPAITFSADVSATPPASFNNVATVSGGGDSFAGNNTATDPTSTRAVDLTIAKTHTGNFTRGQVGATYTITVSNQGNLASSGTVTVTDTLPAGLTATGLSGSGWTCTLSPLQCTRTDALAANSAYPSIVLTVNVATDASTDFVNSATVSGGGDAVPGNNTANDPTRVSGVDLRIVKTQLDQSYYQGQLEATFELRVTNVGESEPTGIITVTENPPAGMTITSMSSMLWSCNINTCTANAAGYTAPIIVQARLSPTAPAQLTNTASVTTSGDTNTSNNTGSTTITVNPAAPDLTITKTHTGNPARGQNGFTYTLTVSNVGNAPSNGTITVTEIPPAGMTVTAMSGGQSWACDLATRSCTNIQNFVIPHGSSAQPITVTVNVASTAAVNLVNSATVAGGGDATPGNNTANDPTTTTGPDLRLVKTQLDQSYYQGQLDATFELRVTNVGESEPTGIITVTENPPAGMTITSMSSMLWSCNINTCTANAAGYTAPIIVQARLSPTAPAQLTNTASVTTSGDTNATNNSGSTTITVNPAAPDLTITKTHTGNPARGQNGFTYTLTVSNVGNAPSNGTITVTEIPPAGMTVTAMSGGQSWACDLATRSCTNIQNFVIPHGSSAQPITVTVNVATTAATNIINSATVAGGGDATPGNNTANDPTTTTGPDLRITKTQTSQSYYQGQLNASFQLQVTNVGESEPTGIITVTDIAPPGMTITSMSSLLWSCNNTTRTCTAPQSTYTSPITVTATIAPTAPAQLTNTATVSTSGDTNSANDTGSTTITVNPAAPDLTITKTHTGNPARGQNGFTYTLTVSNVGNAPSNGTITVTEIPPAGMTVTAMSGGQSWACDLATRSCTNIQNFVIPHGSSAQPITVTVNVATNAAVNLVNSATVAGGGDATPGNNTANDPTTTTGPDLRIVKTHLGDFMQGQVGARYTLIVTNIGTAPTSGAVDVDEQPPAGAFASIVLAGNGWNCAGLRCTRTDALAPNTAYPPITVTVNVAANAPALVVNRATVSTTGDGNASNNTANDPTVVQSGVPDLRINKTHSGVFMQGQTGAAYTISVVNVGSSATTGMVTVIDVLPPGLTATSMTGAGWSCVLATRTCSRNDALAGGASYPPITLLVDVAANAPANVVNIATVTGGGDVNPANNTTQDPTVIGQTAINVSLTLGPVAFNRATNRFVQTVTVQNNGGNLGSAALVLDSLSAGAALVAPDGLTAATSPVGSPYRELGPIPAGGVAVTTLQFTRAGGVPISYVPRLLGPGPR